jgi:pyruvate dehydrogenase E1 component alpha subunit
MKKLTAQDLEWFETRVKEAFKAGEINCPIHLAGGNEDVLIRIFEMINPEDYVFSSHRNHYHYLLKGGDPEKLMDEIKGLASGVCGGKGRSMHVYDHSIRFYTSAILGGTCAIAVGVAMAIKRDGGKEKVYCFLGDGAEDEGAFAEASRYALSKNLPIIFVVEDNNLSVETNKNQRWGCDIPRFHPKVYRYSYIRKYPHVGIGEHVSL